MFQKHLIEDGNLHYGEFMNDLSRLIVSTALHEYRSAVNGRSPLHRTERIFFKLNNPRKTFFIQFRTEQATIQTTSRLIFLDQRLHG